MREEDFLSWVTRTAGDVMELEAHAAEQEVILAKQKEQECVAALKEEITATVTAEMKLILLNRASHERKSAVEELIVKAEAGLQSKEVREAARAEERGCYELDTTRAAPKRYIVDAAKLDAIRKRTTAKLENIEKRAAAEIEAIKQRRALAEASAEQLLQTRKAALTDVMECEEYSALCEKLAVVDLIDNMKKSHSELSDKTVDKNEAVELHEKEEELAQARTDFADTTQRLESATYQAQLEVKMYDRELADLAARVVADNKVEELLAAFDADQHQLAVDEGLIVPASFPE